MGYSWSENISSGTLIKATHVSELHTNINSERTRRGLSNYSWSKVPNSGDKVENADLATEMRTALDAAHGQNTCQSYNATHDAGVLSTHNVTYRTTHDSDHRSSHLSSNRSTHLSGYKNAVQTGYYGSYYTGVQSANYNCACK